MARTDTIGTYLVIDYLNISPVSVTYDRNFIEVIFTNGSTERLKEKQLEHWPKRLSIMVDHSRTVVEGFIPGR